MKLQNLSLAAAVSFLAHAATANLLNVGDVFQVNTYTTATQLRPALASDSAGNFVVAWVSEGQDGAGTAAIRTKLDSSLAVISAEAVANTTTAGDQGLSMDASADASVGSAATGGFLVVWSSPDGAGTGVFAQRYDSSGTAAGTEFRVNTTTSGDEENGAVAVDGMGNFIVAWQSYNDIFAQRYQPDGTALGGEITVDNDPAMTVLADDTPDVAADAAGNFVVVWSNVLSDGFNGILARRYDNTGSPIGTEFLVNTFTPDIQARPRVAMKSTGEFVVVWQSYAQDGSKDGVFGQRYDNTGAAQGTEFQVNLATLERQWRPDVAFDSSGGFVVVWHEEPSPLRSAGITARRYDSSGTPMGAEAALRRGGFGPPSIVSLGGGELVIAFDDNPFASFVPDTEVFVQKLRLVDAPCPPTPAACTASAKSKLKISNPSGDPKKRKFSWQWGGTAALADFDDPLTTTDYALCIYDDGALVASYVVGAGGTCDGKPCWAATGTTGFKYKAKSTNSQGFFKVILKGGAGGGKILVKMRRSNLLLPVPASGTAMFNQTTSLRLQLRKDPAGGPECWETVFGPGPTLNTPTDYQASQP